ncbi:MAG: hypothetical protein KC983_08465 [Phycisphaerales bacterium]|nr:hypothetical protein [Phycisphaerales bacterium]
MAKATSYTHDTPSSSATADAHEAAQGFEADAGDPVRLDAAINHAVHYRGDITVTLRSTGETIEGFAFDRTDATDKASSALRLIPKSGDTRIRIACDDIDRLVFSGRDTAAGKSFETWMKKYVEKKLAGKSANIHCEPLDDAPDA